MKVLRRMGTLLAALAFALALATTALATDIVPTVVGADQLDAVAGSVLMQNFASQIIEDSTSPAPSIPDPFGNNRGDCQGSIQSAAYQINATTWLYLYRMFCNCGPDWDVGYPEVDGFRIPLGTASVVSRDYDGNASLEQLVRGDGNFASGPGLSPFTTLGGGGSVDQIISGHVSSTHVKFYNANGIFGASDVFGFSANAPPILVTGQHLGGSFTSFTIVAPGQPIPEECPLTQGFWKNHPAAWPVTSLTLGSVSYTQAQLLAILNTPVKGDASLILAHQLIAAKLNLANGSDPTPIASTIATADSLLGATPVPQNITPSSATGQAMVSAADVLADYNEGQLTPDCVP